MLAALFGGNAITSGEKSLIFPSGADREPFLRRLRRSLIEIHSSSLKTTRTARKCRDREIENSAEHARPTTSTMESNNSSDVRNYRRNAGLRLKRSIFRDFWLFDTEYARLTVLGNGFVRFTFSFPFSLSTHREFFDLFTCERTTRVAAGDALDSHSVAPLFRLVFQLRFRAARALSTAFRNKNLIENVRFSLLIFRIVKRKRSGRGAEVNQTRSPLSFW